MGNAPYPFQCGGSGEPSCPAEPTLLGANSRPARETPDLGLYTWNEMAAHGYAQYAKGIADGPAAISEPQVSDL